MFFVAGVLVILAGLFYAAEHHELGSLSLEICPYSSSFCDDPLYVLVGAGDAAVWSALVGVR